MGRITQIAASEGHLYALDEHGLVYEWSYHHKQWQLLRDNNG